MKLKSIFKKDKKSVSAAKTEKMDKKQLEKIIGGGSGTTTVVTQDPAGSIALNSSRSNKS